MKKLFTRVLAGALGVSMLFSGSVFAVDEDAVKAPSDIDPLAYEAIYSQLKRQDALDMMDVAEYVYRTTNPPKTGVVPHGSEDDYTKIYAQYGGNLEYHTRVNDTRVEVNMSFMDYDNSYYYILSQQIVDVFDVLQTVFGFLPIIGPLASGGPAIQALVDSAASESIIAAKGYAKITVSQKTAKRPVSMLTGWTHYPYLYLDDPHAWEILPTIIATKKNPW
ncbi:MAG: hypothetical protein V8S34_04860 [Lawsonibacter sp.]